MFFCVCVFFVCFLWGWFILLLLCFCLFVFLCVFLGLVVLFLGFSFSGGFFWWEGEGWGGLRQSRSVPGASFTQHFPFLFIIKRVVFDVSVVQFTRIASLQGTIPKCNASFKLYSKNHFNRV